MFASLAMVAIVAAGTFGSTLVATALSGAVILILPGTLLLALLSPSIELDLPELTVFGFAVSWCLLTLLCVLAFVIHGNALQSERAILLLDAGLAIALYRRPPAAWPKPDRWQIALLVGVAVIAVTAYRIGGYTEPRTGPTVAAGWGTADEAVHLVTMRKVAETPRLYVDQVMYVKGEFVTYFYPAYAFVMALMSHASGMDPLVIYDTFRLWTAALGLLAFYALAAATIGSAAGMIAGMAALVLVAAGRAGPAVGVGAWGQLIPLTQLGDFGLGVLLPLSIAVVIHFVRERRGRYLFTTLAFPLLFAAMVTHAREAAHVVSYLAAALAIAPIVGGITTRQWFRLAGLTAALLVSVSIYSTQVLGAVPFIREHEEASAARARVETQADLQAGIGLALRPAELPEVLKPFVTLSFLIAPALLVGLRPTAGVVLLFSGLLAWWLPLYLPLAGRLLETRVYSEIMTSPGRYVFHASYVVYGLAAYAALVALDRVLARVSRMRRWGAGVLIGTCATVAAAAALTLLPDLLDQRFGAMPLATAVAAAVLALTASRARKPAGRTEEAMTAGRPTFRFPWLIAATALLAATGIAVRSPNGTLLESVRSRGWQPTRDAKRWYGHTGLGGTLPWSTVEMLRRIPAGAVIATDPALGLAVPLVANHYVLVSGTTLTSDLHYLEAVLRISGEQWNPDDEVDWGAYRSRMRESIFDSMHDDILRWERYARRLGRLAAMGRPAAPRLIPVFGDVAPAAETRRFLAALHPDYMLISSTDHPPVAWFIARSARSFEPIDGDGRFQLYRIRYPIESE